MINLEGIGQWWRAGQFKRKQRFVFYTMLSLMLDNGVQMITALEEMYNIYSDDGRKRRDIVAIVCQDCAIALSSGVSLSNALYKWVSYDEFSLIKSGEESGNLQAAFAKAMTVLTNKKRVRGAIMTATLYPSIIFLQAGYLMRKVATDLVPKLGNSSRPETWDAAARSLKVTADFIVNYGGMIVLSLIALVITVLFSMPTLNGRIRYYLDKTFPFNIYRMMHGGPFLMNVGVMLSSGVKMETALQTLGERASPWLRVRINDTLHGVRLGLPLGKALHQAGHDFPDKMAVKLLQVISGQKDSEDVIETFGLRWIDESIVSIEKSANALRAFAIALNALIMLWVLAGASGMSSGVLNGIT